MPLLWAHAEFLKLLSAQANRRASESLAIVDERYGGKRPNAATWHWREASPFDTLPAGRSLLIERTAPFSLSYALDGGSRSQMQSTPMPLGMHAVSFAPDKLAGGTRFEFVFNDSSSDVAANTIAIAPDAER
jgi:glucoamylase